MRVSLLLLLVCAACGHAAAGPEETAPVDPVNDVAAEELFQRGVTLAQNGDLIRGEQYIGASILRGYPEERALPVLLKVCIAASRLRIAIGYAEPYLARHPNDWSLRLVVASLYLGLDDAVKARRQLEQVLSTKPDEAEPHYLMAIVLRDEVGDPEGAAEHFQRYMALAPDGPHAEEVAHALDRIHVVLPSPIPEQPSSEAEEESQPAETPE
jgi:tetratricopeptide (TPR) repeat protein